MAKRKQKREMTPAIPPDDYSGTQADWMIKLQERGLWNGKGWHGDIEIPTDIWWEILEECEGED
jgi:hypothetical protein